MKEEQKEKKEVVSEKSKKVEKTSSKKWIIGLFGFAIVVLVALSILIGGIYIFQWNNSLTKPFLSVTNLPAAMVDGKMISLAKFNKATESLEKYQELESSLGEGSPEGEPTQPTPEELRVNLLARMIDDLVVEHLLKDHNESVSDQDVDEELVRLDEVLGEDITVEDHVREIYGWSLEEFKDFALRPGLQEFKLHQAFVVDETIGGELRSREIEARDKAAGIIEDIRSGADFSEKAKDSSEDTFTAEKGGDLGLISRGEMVPDFEKVAFSLEKGEVSDPVKTQFGYHIIQVDEIEGEGDAEKRKVRHILFLLEDKFTEWFSAERASSSVAIYDRRFKWNAELGKVEAR